MPSFGGVWMADARHFHPLFADDLVIAIRTTSTFRLTLAAVFSLRCAAVLDRFPYVILFEHESQVVRFLGIFHAATDPKKWFDRSGHH